MEITKYYKVLIFNYVIIIINSSSKQLEITIKKHSLLFQILPFGKLYCFSDKNWFQFDDIIFLRMKRGKKIFSNLF